MTVVPAQYCIETYAPSELDALAQEFKIPEAQRAELAKLLHTAAAIWRWHDDAQRGTEAPAKSTKALSNVSKHARKLRAALHDLPPTAFAALAAEATTAENGLLTVDADVPKFLGVMVPEQDGSETPVTLDMRDIGCLLDVLADMSEQASALAPGRSGKRVDEALRMWIINIDDFWTKSLGRPFVRTLSEKGEAVSEAAHFCVTAFRNVSPETAPSTVLNAMKKHIASQRKKRMAN